MKYGAWIIAANKAGAKEIIDPRPFTTGTSTETFRQYPDICPLLPAMGYSDEQINDLEQTINSSGCDAVLIGTPIDLTRVVNINKPATRVWYCIKEIGDSDLKEVIDKFLGQVSV
jgi:predicted GTPase